MNFSDTERATLKALRDLLLMDVDEYQYGQLKEFRDKLVDEIKRMNYSVGKLVEQKRLLSSGKDILVASGNDLLGATFDLLIHCIDREIAAITPTQKEEKKLDLERRLATIQGKRQLSEFIGAIIGIRTEN